MQHSYSDSAFRRCGGYRRIVLLLLSGITLVTATTFPAVAHPTGSAHPHATHIAEASRRFGIPASWIVAVVRAESAGDTRAVSSAGAIGLMQIMPRTWAELRVRYNLGHDVYHPRDNILAGTAYLREMWDRYGNVAAMLAAYNAGPARYEEHRATGRPLPAETRAYVAALAPILRGARPSKVSVLVEKPLDWRESTIFVMRDGGPSSGDLLPPGRISGDLRSSSRTTPAELHARPPRRLFVPRRAGGGAP